MEKRAAAGSREKAVPQYAFSTARPLKARYDYATSLELLRPICRDNPLWPEAPQPLRSLKARHPLTRGIRLMGTGWPT